MSVARRDVPRMTPNRKLFLVLIHNVQFLFAVVVLSLDAYSIRYMVYTSLAYSFVVALSTMCGCAYMLASLTIMPKLFIKTVAVVWNVVLWIFWIVNTGCTGRLAWMWRAKSPCSVEGVDYGYDCDDTDPQQDPLVLRRDLMSSKTFAGILITAAIFSGLQILLFALTGTAYISAESVAGPQREQSSNNVSMRSVSRGSELAQSSSVSATHGHPNPAEPSTFDIQNVPSLRRDTGTIDDTRAYTVAWGPESVGTATYLDPDAKQQDPARSIPPAFAAEDTGLNLRAGETRHELYNSP